MPLRVTLELIPYGDESKKKTIGVLDIENDGTGAPGNGKGVGHYDYRIQGLVQDDPTGPSFLDFWQKGRIEGFQRERGHWALVQDILAQEKLDYVQSPKSEQQNTN